MNTKVLEGKWTQLRGKAQQRWGRLTNDDLQQIKGQRMALEGKLRERYGLTMTEASNQVDTFLDETGARATEMQEELQHKVEDKRQRLQNRVDEARQEMRGKVDDYSDRLGEMQSEDMAQIVQSKPVVLLALALLSGLLIGLWIKSMKS